MVRRRTASSVPDRPEALFSKRHWQACPIGSRVIHFSGPSTETVPKDPRKKLCISLHYLLLGEATSAAPTNANMRAVFLAPKWPAAPCSLRVASTREILDVSTRANIMCLIIDGGGRVLHSILGWARKEKEKREGKGMTDDRRQIRASLMCVAQARA
ncbi:uncharacterized protein MCYG_02668 [Microsporum canis CBS 113480]|uniref:Uncharacterized protein n=1 Tax=Arthroderma otae (strain ATCC MYA-4605 / CBS 113480) TaxID=554155 RepID=C5FGG4_ARTOC|nr:uncharacterized protein MCYG_02668 [Microsporum canis CBS 113480]EEQ29849.1 predicted protein [Microsporum canis CBS 113480]